MKLVIKTKVIARTNDARYIEWLERTHIMPLVKMDFFDCTFIEQQVHKWACRHEKHFTNYHETVDTWYVEPEVANGN
jgi:hypothetical protein